jgi:hypothetical protein
MIGLFILLSFPFSFATEYFSLESGLYKQTQPVSTELCDQEVRALYNRETNILAGIYVRYVGQCLSQGPFYYFCNEEMNTCSNIGHRFHLVGDNQFIWSYDSLGISGSFSLTPEAIKPH